jgi:hypothetical protein
MDSLRREVAREDAAEKTVEKENEALPSGEIYAAQSPPNYSQVALAEALPANLQPSHLYDQNRCQSVPVSGG